MKQVFWGSVSTAFVCDCSLYVYSLEDEENSV